MTYSPTDPNGKATIKPISYNSESQTIFAECARARELFPRIRLSIGMHEKKKSVGKNTKIAAQKARWMRNAAGKSASDETRAFDDVQFGNYWIRSSNKLRAGDIGFQMRGASAAAAGCVNIFPPAIMICPRQMVLSGHRWLSASIPSANSAAFRVQMRQEKKRISYFFLLNHQRK